MPLGSMISFQCPLSLGTSLAVPCSFSSFIRPSSSSHVRTRKTSLQACNSKSSPPFHGPLSQTHSRKPSHDLPPSKPDGFLARVGVALFRHLLSPSVQWVSPRPGYDGMVDECRMLLAKKGPRELYETVTRLLLTLFVAPVGPDLFRRFFADKPRLNARITPLFFSWLVGENEVNTPEGAAEDTGVKIAKCKFLEESGCKGLCVNMCKIPTERFFTDQLGLPLRMTPNFEDMSCQMAFGVPPLPLEEDPALAGDCLAHCKMSGSYRSAKKEDPCYVTKGSL